LGDTTRSWLNFDMRLALQPYLMYWSEVLSWAPPGWEEFASRDKGALLEEAQSKTPEEDPRRFDISVLDALIERLPK